MQRRSVVGLAHPSWRPLALSQHRHTLFGTRSTVLPSSFVAQNAVAKRGAVDFVSMLKLKEQYDAQTKKQKEANRKEKEAQEIKRAAAEEKIVQKEVAIKTITGRTRRLSMHDIKIRYDTKGLLRSGQILTMDYIHLQGDEVKHLYFGGICLAHKKKSNGFYLLNTVFGERVEMLGYFSSPLITNMKINNKFVKSFNKWRLYYLRDKEQPAYELDVADADEDILKKTA